MQVGHLLPESCKGHHRLKVIYSSGSDMEEDVVRWCEDCGSVVVDKDFDGRTNAGQVISMQTPQILFKKL